MQAELNKKDWNPELYLKFGKERTQPSIDLVSRISKTNPQSIADIGCGPGNSTQILALRWPSASIKGIDNSPAMIEKAKKDYPSQEWLLSDAGRDALPGNLDIIFSNATIQWIQDHAGLLKKFHEALNDDGLIAVQIPLFWDMAIGKAIADIATDIRWAAVTKGATEMFTIHDHIWYYDQLSILYSTIEMWKTSYMHVMDSHMAIVEMIRSTGLKPYFERLESEKDRQDFEAMVLKTVKHDYPQQQNGKVIFPFERLFFIAKK